MIGLLIVGASYDEDMTMVWMFLLALVAVLGFLLWRYDQKIKQRYDDSRAPREWTLPESSPPLSAFPVAEIEMPPARLTYRKKSPLLDVSKCSIYSSLQNILGGQYLMLTHQPIKDVLMADEQPAMKSVRSVAQLSLVPAYFDAVICTKIQGELVCACIITPPAGALSQSLHISDALTEACASASLPLLLIPADCSEQELRTHVLRNLGGAIKLQGADIEPEAECPQCKGAMTKRKVSAGVHQGKWLWVCNRYPECKGVRS
jgi:hypothetical protein